MNEVRVEKQRVSRIVTMSFLTAIAGVCVLIGFLSIGGCGKGQEDGAEAKKAVKQTRIEPKWGPEVNGICAAFEFVPKKDSYAIGETIGTMILIRNPGKKPLKKLETMRSSFYGHSIITAEDANVPKLAEVNWLQSLNIDPNKMIEPGEVLTYQGPEIQVRRFYPDGTYPPRNAPNIVYFFPGEYRLRFTLEFGRKFKIETGEHKFVIVDANE